MAEGGLRKESDGGSCRAGVPDYVRVILITDMNGRKRKLLIPAALDLDRPKRPRTTFSAKQVQVLELEFQQSHFVAESRRQALATVLGLSETQIKVWFQNRRTKLRRDSSDESSEIPEPSPGIFSTPFPWAIGKGTEKKA